MKNNESRSLDRFDKKTTKLVLIDSNAIIHRAYHALPPNMKNSKGELTNAVYGFTTTLIKVLEDLKPDYIAASFDVSKQTFRVKQYDKYKANRIKADQELYDQIPRVRGLLEVLDIPIYEKEGFEADDVIGTIVSRLANKNNKIKIINNKSGSHSVAGSISNEVVKPSNHLAIYIVTGDKDLFQLVNGNVFVYSLKKGLSQMEIVDREHIKKEYNLDPTDFIDLKALAGDPSDNIPGVPNIGKVTATKLLQEFDTLKNLYNQLEINFQFSIFNFQSISNDENFKTKTEQLGIKPRILKLLIENKDQAFLSQKLATIHCEVPIDFNIDDCKWGEYDKDKLKSFFEELGFRSLLRRFGAEKSAEAQTNQAHERKKDKQLKLL